MDLSIQAGVAGINLNILKKNIKYLFCYAYVQKLQLFLLLRFMFKLYSLDPDT